MGIAETLERIMGSQRYQESKFQRKTMESKITQDLSSYNQQVENSIVTYKCNLCNDTTWILIDGKARRCSCYESEKIEVYFKKSGIDIKQNSYTFSAYKEKDDISKGMKLLAMNYYKNYDSIKESKGNSIAFLGSSGIGKTHLEIALALNFIRKKGLRAVYMPYRDVVSKMKRNMMDESFISKEISIYKNAEILVIDDLLKGKVNDSDINILFEIINYRYVKNAPMIISSEYTIEMLLKFDEAIGSRIYEMCRDYIYETIDGQNHRVG